jgi:murein DD-endopeptidase MepM/ murein hydrolase activator NlpD
MRRPLTSAPARLGDHSWTVGLAILALAGGGLATRAAGGPQQGHHGDKGAAPTTTVVCDPTSTTSSTTTTTTTTTVPGSTVPDPCAPTTTTATTAPAQPSTTAGGPGATDTGAPAATTAPADAAATSSPPPTTAADSTTTTVPSAEPDVEAPQLPAAPAEDWPIRAISFPVAGPITYYDDWGACRGGADCPRRHIGNDLIGRRLQPLLAATDGVVTHLVLDHPTAGWGLVITDAQGWDYRYYHVNNDTPGTDDGAAPAQWRLAPGITEGSTVTAGQVVAYLGDSGNSELSVPHLHFEIHQPDGSPIDPYRSLRAAEWMARCSVAAPGVQKESALMPPVNAAEADVVVATSTGRGQFLLSLDGTVLAQGDAATVGWSRHLADDPPCPAPGTPPGDMTLLAAAAAPAAPHP